MVPLFLSAFILLVQDLLEPSLAALVELFIADGERERSPHEAFQLLLEIVPALLVVWLQELDWSRGSGFWLQLQLEGPIAAQRLSGRLLRKIYEYS